MHPCAYLHGFGSSASSKKGVQLAARLAPDGVVTTLPDLNVPSFEKLSLRAALEHLDRVLDGGDWVLVGSSLGGWMASRFAELHPGRVRELVLLCPAFDFAYYWPRVLPLGAIDRWREVGTMPLPDARGRLVPVHYELYAEAEREPPYPAPRCPVTVIHGTLDDRVPIASSRTWVAESPDTRRLIEVEDGHDLLASLDPIELEVRRALGLGS